MTRDNCAGEEASHIGESIEPQPFTGMTGFKRNLLLATARLAGERPHGLVIKAELEDFYDEEINHGRLYQNLGELVESDLVEKTPIDGRTNAYQLTEEAKTRLKQHHAWEAQCLSKAEAR